MRDLCQSLLVCLSDYEPWRVESRRNKRNYDVQMSPCTLAVDTNDLATVATLLSLTTLKRLIAAFAQGLSPSLADL